MTLIRVIIKIMKFDFARDALKYLIKKFDIKEIHLPYYLCDVIRHSVVEMNCKPLYYHIDDNFLPTCEFNREDYILYPNYFGICDKNVKNLVDKYPKLIVDNAHSYYSQPSGFASFNAEHKFLPVEKGAYLWIGKGNNNVKVDLVRREKFMYYHSCLKNNLLKIDIDENTIPFCYPYLAQSEIEANKVVDELKKKGLIIYRYWNRLPQSYNEYKFYSRLVPIPLDD